MKIILNVDRNIFPDKRKAGETVDVNDNIALRWIDKGFAHYVDTDYSSYTSIEPRKLKDYIRHNKVTIIIPVFNALDYLKKCLDSLTKYTQNYELVIIDNGSDKDTKQYLQECRKHFGFKLQTNKENMGFSYACNQGIKISTCDWLCFLNSDTVLTFNWLGKLMKGFSMPNAGIVGPSTCFSGGKQMIWPLKARRMSMTQDDMNSVDTESGIVETEIYGFCYTVSRKVIDDIGVFDVKRYPIGSAEEKDFSWRAEKAGYKSYHVRDSYVHHYGNKTFIEMGVSPQSIRVKNDKAFNDRKSNKNIYVKNTVNIDDYNNQLKEIPILMIVLDRLEYTKKAIRAVLKNTLYPFKLFIFNNGSAEHIRWYLKNLQDSRIEVFNSRTNLGLTAPMNMFFDKFKDSKYVAKVDNDTVVSKGWLGKLKDVMDAYPLFTVQANHYLAMPFKIETNDDFYKHLFGVDFNEDKIYFYKNSGGTGQLIRRSVIDKPMPKSKLVKGGLSGWCNVQVEKYKQWPSAFYTGTWIERLDQVGTNKYKEISDYPDYDEMIAKMRPWGLGYANMNTSELAKIKEEMKAWYSKNDHGMY